MFRERPSKTYGIKGSLAAFLFDRGIYHWGTFVENKMDEAEQNIRRSMRNRKGTDTFVLSARQATYNKLLGIKDTKNVYKQPQIVKQQEAQKQISGEGTVNLNTLN